MNLHRHATALAVVLAALSAPGCKGKCNNPGPTDGCRAPDGGACYDIELVGLWSEDRQGVAVPGPAHFTTLYGAVHDRRFRIFQQGGIASRGMELLAEDGDIGVVQNDVADQLESGVAADEVCGDESVDATGSTTTSIVTDRDHTRLSFASMVAPSPDWFVGVDALELWDDDAGGWREVIELELFVYDAGTERDDSAFSLDNDEEKPPKTITVAHDRVFPGGGPAIAQIRIQRIR